MSHHFCLVCKELVEPKYEVSVRDTEMDTELTGVLCRFCYHKFVDSFHNRGFFKIHKMINWAKKKDRIHRL